MISSTLCLAIALYHEARSTSIKEQIEVLQVMQNRAYKQNKNICKVVFDKNQFSWAKNFKVKYKFKNNNEAINYYKITDFNSFITQLGIVTSSKLNINDVYYYHDNNIKNFDWNKNNLVVINKTKNFVFYKDKK